MNLDRRSLRDVLRMNSQHEGSLCWICKLLHKPLALPSCLYTVPLISYKMEIMIIMIIIIIEIIWTGEANVMFYP